ncbi:MAG: Uma2 family endonuclease [Caldilinea sp.]
MLATLCFDTQVYPLVVHLPMAPMDDAQLMEFCRANPELHIERNAEGEVIVMSPIGAETSHRNLMIGAMLYLWAVRDGSGVAFDSSGGFLLPNGAMRAPDAAWVRRSRLAKLTRAEKRGFLPLCPDFVVELRSESDRLDALQAKMDEYIANGAQLGWLIDPLEQVVYIYRPQQPIQRLVHPAVISGDPVLSGFTLNLTELWEPLE